MKTIKTTLKSLPAIIISIIVVAGITYAAGSLTAPTGTPSATGYTLGDIYNKILDITFTPSEHSVSTTTDPATTFASLSEIYTALDNATTTLVAGNIADGVEVFGVTGTLAAGVTFPTEWSADASGTVNWTAAMAYCDNLTEGGATAGDWHLPTYTELVNALLTSVPDFQTNNVYWSSTDPYDSGHYHTPGSSYYNVNMGSGVAAVSPYYYGMYARCAR